MKLLVLCSMCCAATRLAAQVGHLPDRSPYRDLDATQEFTFVVGQFRPARDPVGVAPSSGLLTGLQYEWRPKAGFHLAGALSRIASERTIIDPTSNAPDHSAHVRSWPLWAGDATMGLALTGAKSWHRLIPMLNGGVGIVSDFHGADSAGFQFGTRFAFVFGGGVRWLRGERFQLRGDITDRWYSVSYPQSYYESPPLGSAVLTARDANSHWLHNPALTIGFTYFARRR